MNIITGGSDAFDALLYPNQNINNLSYFERQWQNTPQALSSIGSMFLDNAKKHYEQAYNSEAMRIANNALNMTQSNKDGYVIGYNTVSTIQGASLYMQRWLMAAVAVKEAYLKQSIDGYSDTYEPVSRYAGEEDYDYRRVMSGVVQPTANGCVIKHYIEDLLPNDKNFNGEEQLTIISTWDIMTKLLKSNIDTTNIYGEECDNN